MKILVTGGAGFIGSHIVDAYVQEHHNVVVVDDLSTGSKQNINPQAKFVQMDIRDNKLEEIFRNERFDVVNHHAAQMDVRKSVADPQLDASINVLGGLNVFENARRHGVRKIIFSSTGGAIYGEQDYFPADELHPLRPLSPYGITKLCTEKYLFYYKHVHSIDHVILRYANIYGPRQNPHGEAGVIAIFASKMIRHEQPVINGDGKQTRDYVFVGDVVNANIAALKLDGTNIFNLGTGVEHDVNYLFHHLREHLYKDCPENHGPTKIGEQIRSVISYAKIHKELGWSPAVSLEKGLARTADYFKTKKEL